MRSLHPPGEYAAWVSWLDAFAVGTDLPDGHLPPVGEAMGPHMQSRVIERLARSFEARAARWAHALQRDLDTVRADPMTLAVALVAARGRLGPLTALAADTRLADDVRDELRSALESLVGSAQDSLDDSVRRSRDPLPLQAVVRDNDLRRAFAPPPAPALPERRPDDPAPVPSRGRRVIL